MTPLTDTKKGKKTFDSSFEIHANIFREEYHHDKYPYSKLRKSVDMKTYSGYAGERVAIPEHRVYCFKPRTDNLNEQSEIILTQSKVSRSQSALHLTKKSTNVSLIKKNSSCISLKLFNNRTNHPSHQTTRTQSFLYQ